MAAAKFMMMDTSFWLNRRQIEDAENAYYAKLSGATPDQLKSGAPAQASQQGAPAASAAGGDNASLLKRLLQVEQENKELRKVTSDLQAAVKGLEARIKSLEVSGGSAPQTSVKLSPAPPQAASKDADDSDDDSDSDMDLFGSDDEEAAAEAEKLKQERIAAYAAKKAKKPQLIAKSNVILDVKPWDDETDMAEMEKEVRAIEMDGLLWGAAKLVPVGYGIKKLQIATVIEDDKVSVEELTEKIEAFEDFVQSVDIAAFNKL